MIFYQMKDNKNLLKYLFKKHSSIKKIRGEASLRSFYRIDFDKYSLIAMVYPEGSKSEIDKFLKFNNLYKKNHINVPEIYDVLEKRIIVVQDLGEVLLQKYLKKSKLKQRFVILEKIKDVITRLQTIDINNTDFLLDYDRLKFEMEFFINNFYLKLKSDKKHIDRELMKNELFEIINKINITDKFAHRDFHTRNIIVFNDEFYLIDYQDSLRANKYYDYVSFIFDSYFEFDRYRDYFIKLIERDFEFDEELFYLTALQRNIKALGSFGYQIYVRNNKKYLMYLNRTIRNIINNPMIKESLKKYFSSIII